MFILKQELWLQKCRLNARVVLQKQANVFLRNFLLLLDFCDVLLLLLRDFFLLKDFWPLCHELRVLVVCVGGDGHTELRHGGSSDWEKTSSLYKKISIFISFPVPKKILDQQANSEWTSTHPHQSQSNFLGSLPCQKQGSLREYPS